jgi:hypothetical protein
MKLSSQNSKFLRKTDFKLFFKSILLGFIIMIVHWDLRIILENQYEMTGEKYYIILAILITFCYLKYF